MLPLRTHSTASVLSQIRGPRTRFTKVSTAAPPRGPWRGRAPLEGPPRARRTHGGAGRQAQLVDAAAAERSREATDHRDARRWRTCSCGVVRSRGRTGRCCYRRRRCCWLLLCSCRWVLQPHSEIAAAAYSQVQRVVPVLARVRAIYGCALRTTPATADLLRMHQWAGTICARLHCRFLKTRTLWLWFQICS